MAQIQGVLLAGWLWEQPAAQRETGNDWKHWLGHKTTDLHQKSKNFLTSLGLQSHFKLQKCEFRAHRAARRGQNPAGLVLSSSPILHVFWGPFGATPTFPTPLHPPLHLCSVLNFQALQGD